MNALTGNEARGQMCFSIVRNALTGNAQNDTAYSITVCFSLRQQSAYGNKVAHAPPSPAGIDGTG
ncbi:MAG: hypothetical protein LBP64_05680 [Tannerella sp.]|nr:hypothetical protein [Tannerella sp.]